MYKTANGREIHFVGEGLKMITPINEKYDRIKTLDDLFGILLKCYEKQTAYPDCQEGYNRITNPTSGQCAITSVIVQEIFGGTIHEINATEDLTHLFNMISGEIVDLTSDQFSTHNIRLNYESNKEVSREECLSNDNTLKRYTLLKEKLVSKLREMEEQQER